MEKNEIIALMQDKISGEISKENEEYLTQRLLEDEDLAREFSEMENTWSLFSAIERPTPSAAMDEKFEQLLTAHSHSKTTHTPVLLPWLEEQFMRSWKVAFTFLLVGLLVGWLLLPSQNQQQDIQQLSSEIQGMKEMMMLTLIEQPKAQERIRAVNLAADLPDAKGQVIDALITTLNNDENVNVRLASLESLVGYTNQPKVREALVNSLKAQESALMLVAIADVLVQIQEKSSLETMEELEESIENEIVKEKLSQSIITLSQS